MVFFNEILVDSSREARRRGIEVIDILGGPNVIKAVRLHTVKDSTLTKDRSETWPCILEATINPIDGSSPINIEIRIYGFTSGSNNYNARDLNCLLKYAGFNIENYIFTKVFRHKRFEKH